MLPNLPSSHSIFCKGRFQLQQRGDLGLEIFGLHSISNSFPVRTRGDSYSSQTGKRGLDALPSWTLLQLFAFELPIDLPVL